jgi:hypothetical protein
MSDKWAPETITNVSNTQFSIARFYGGVTLNGFSYIYNPETDELKRADVLRADEKAKIEADKYKRLREKVQTMELFLK